MVGYAVICNGIAILITGGVLMWSEEFSFDMHWILPFKDYSVFERWVWNADLLVIFRMEVGVFCIIQMYNILLSASMILPSLGILFHTIERSLSDIFIFSTICMLIFSIFVVIFHLSFGEQNYFYSTVPNALVTCFQMFLGEINYTAMFKADP